MASIGESSGFGKRPLTAEVNLVPFIDLLSMSICFLLMTAVWVQMGALPVEQSRGTNAATAPRVFGLELQLTGPAAWELRLTQAERIVREVRVQGADASAALRQLESAVPSLLGLPGKALPISGALVTPGPGVPYRTLIATMDVLRRFSVSNLSVVASGG